ncbi:HIV Tat-specific factor 1 homolog [Daphnia pulex]|uniref:HIV Tat-specific factor 1 homolog n=1 Tax=Daphnia pulex TaxID=6669 RepID=UPI001EE0449B|nr:HIV Tat-specific factor 1 homolog [Daphnia pulex]
MNASSYSYEGDVCIHTDPATGYQYKWNAEEKKWEPNTKIETQVTADSNAEAKYERVGNTYVYKDESGRLLEWDLEAKEWKPKLETQTIRRIAKNPDEEFDSSDESGEEKLLEQKKSVINHHVHVNSDGVKTYTDPSDGTIFEWDEEKKAWFPKLDEEFIARYQLSYGGEASTEPVAELEKKKVEPPPKIEKKQVSEPNWFEVDQTKNTKVYVTNLPTEINEEEIVEFMQKCGMIEKDLETGKHKIKLYRNENGQVKGDALCTYIKIESVELALKILDGSVLKDKTVGVERATFTLKGNYDPTKKPRKRKKKDVEKLRKKQEKLFDWRPDKLRGERARNENVVVLKRLFKPEEFDVNPAMLLEYQRDLREECAKFGHVKRVVIFDRNEEGAAQVFFKTPEEADRCVEVLHGRWFAGQKITAETWDGQTKYRKDETEEEKAARLKKWSEFLTKEEQGESDDD